MAAARPPRDGRGHGQTLKHAAALMRAVLRAIAPLGFGLGWSLLLLSFAAMSAACDTDADCGAGATCIQRAKGAIGVCYGSAARPVSSDEQAADEPGVDASVKPLTGERREIAKQWLGDPEQMIKDNLPDKEVGGNCIVTQDCPAGFDCVIAGFEGHCVKL